RRRDVSVDLRWAAQLDGGGRLDVADDLAFDDDRAAADLGRDLGAVADHEQVVGRDLAGERAVDPDLALEGELAFELGALAEQCVQVARAGCRVPGSRVVARISLLHGLVPFRGFLFAARFRCAGGFRRFGGTPHRRRRWARRTARSFERKSGHYPLNAPFHRTSPPVLEGHETAGRAPSRRARAGAQLSWSCGGISRCLCGGERWAWSVPTSPRRCQRYRNRVMSSSTAAATMTISRAAIPTSPASSAWCR